jgi:hypothetical protein
VPYVPIKEAARILGVSEDTIHRRLKAGKLQGAQQERPGGWMWMVEVPSVDSVGCSTPSLATTTPPSQLPTSSREAELLTEVRLLREQISQLQGQLQLQTLIALEALQKVPRSLPTGTTRPSASWWRVLAALWRTRHPRRTP